MRDYPLPQPGQDPQYSPPHRRPPSRRAPRKRRGWPFKLLLAAAALALVCVGVRLYLKSQEPVTFLYRDMTLEAIEGVPVNRYGLEGFFTDERGRVHYERGGAAARMGIDVSFYQGEVDWPAVAADGVEFVLIRLGYRGYTEGGLKMDSRYEENLRGALDAGLDVGVYFFSQAVTPQEAREEAQFVLDTLAGQALSYPVVFDWEPITPGKEARTDGLDGETLTQCAAAFCAQIAQGGYTPAVYFNQDQGYLTYDLGRLSQYPFWLADYDSAPDFYYHFALWQYTHTGSVAGIQGNVDWNLDFSPVNEE